MSITSNDCWAANGLALSLERDENDGGNRNWAQANGWKNFGIRLSARAGFAELPYLRSMLRHCSSEQAWRSGTALIRSDG